MDEQYLLAAVRYVERNPVRARMAKHAWDYRWSSAAAHVRGEDDILVKVRPMLERVADWPEYIGQEPTAFEVSTLRLHNRTGRPLGSAGFVEKLERLLGRTLKPLKPGPKGQWKHK
jgi:putative transposase